MEFLLLKKTTRKFHAKKRFQILNLRGNGHAETYILNQNWFVPVTF